MLERRENSKLNMLENNIDWYQYHIWLYTIAPKKFSKKHPLQGRKCGLNNLLNSTSLFKNFNEFLSKKDSDRL